MSRRPKRPRIMPTSERYIMLHHWMTKSVAFRHLPGDAVKLIVVLATRHNGHNNGEVALSLRDAAREVGCSPNHATKLFRLLDTRGFIDVTQRGHFSLKTRHASTYKLNWLPMRRTEDSRMFHDPTKEFMLWLPGEVVQKRTPQIQNTVAPCETDSPTP